MMYIRVYFEEGYVGLGGSKERPTMVEDLFESHWGDAWFCKTWQDAVRYVLFRYSDWEREGCPCG